MSIPVPVPRLADDVDSAPTHTQQLFPAHADNMCRIKDEYGQDLAAMSVAELLAFNAAITQELSQRSDSELAETITRDDASLSPGDLSRVAEENQRRFYNFQCRLAYLLEGWFETIEARAATLAHKGKRPFKNARDFIARLLGIDAKEVDRRLRIATANPTRPGASKMHAPKIEKAMADGNIDPSSASFIIDRLRSIRAASKRAGATDSQADRLVETKEGELLAKALHAGPDEVRKFADRIKRATNRQFIAPGTRLTPKQRKYEEGLRFISPLGDDHVRLDWVLTKWQFRNVLERLKHQVNNLRTDISKLNRDMDTNPNGTALSGAQRITPAEEEFELPMLYDDRTPAQRWSHFLLDILETGIVLTSLPSGQAQEFLNQQTSKTTDTEPHPEDVTPSGVVIPGLGKLINVVPNITVGLQYSDLAGQFVDYSSDEAGVQQEIARLIHGRKPIPELYDFDAMDLDWAQLRRMSCDASIIPMILNSKGEPLDVGRSQRVSSTGIHRAVIMRDGGCAYPGCNMPHMYSEVHHIQHWQDGGSTALSNMVLMCRFHHMIIHQTDVLVRLNDDQFPEFLLNANTDEAVWLRNHMHRG